MESETGNIVLVLIAISVAIMSSMVVAVGIIWALNSLGMHIPYNWQSIAAVYFIMIVAQQLINSIRNYE